jgi:uncharacterized lipoprotein NlpE involved in copper resistance
MKKVIVVSLVVFVVVILSGCDSRKEKIKSPAEKCEEVGGWYRSGGFWDIGENCIFPPKNNN